MTDTMTQLGIGGIVALLIIREVLRFLRSRNGSSSSPAGSSGSQSIEFWQAEIRKAVSEALNPFLSAQSELLRGIQITESKIHEAVMELVILTRQMAERGRQ